MVTQGHWSQEAVTLMPPESRIRPVLFQQFTAVLQSTAILYAVSYPDAAILQLPDVDQLKGH